jgi:hypothetical protein
MLRTLFNEAVMVNPMVFKDIDTKSGEQVFAGSEMETATELGWLSFRKTRDDTFLE